MEGIVRWFSNKLGYGFIISPGVPELTNPDGKPRDVFVHYTKIQMDGFRKLEPDEQVTYDLVWSADKKPQAERVARLDVSKA
jgi:cold shock protein